MHVWDPAENSPEHAALFERTGMQGSGTPNPAEVRVTIDRPVWTHFGLDCDALLGGALSVSIKPSTIGSPPLYRRQLLFSCTAKGPRPHSSVIEWLMEHT